MRLPAPKPPIGVEAARVAVASGKTAAEFARDTGHSAGAVRNALQRAGAPVGPRRSMLRNSTDRRLYSIWRTLRARCENPNSAQFHLYGDRKSTRLNSSHTVISYA